MVVAGVVEVGEDGEAAAGAVFLGIAVDDEVLAALPIHHHECPVGLSEESIDGAGNAVSGQNLNVDVTSGCYNLMAREFWNASNQTPAKALDDENKQIYSTSDAVVHLIDGVLIFSTSQLTSWADEVQKAIDDANASSSRRK